MATQPCPCGFYTDPTKECTCSPTQILWYMAKVSGPLLDRIDLHIDVPAVKYKELASKEPSERSECIRERVIYAREIQVRRFRQRGNLFCNAHMQSQHIKEFCRIDSAGEDLMKMAITKLGLSARAYDRILKVSRTIADVIGSEDIRPEHLSEVIQNRSLGRNFYAL